MTRRSNRADVRNPVLALPEARELAQLMDELPPHIRCKAIDLLTALSRQCREKADVCWFKHKPPMAAYWKEWAVNWRHLRLALRSPL